MYLTDEGRNFISNAWLPFSVIQTSRKSFVEIAIWYMLWSIWMMIGCEAGSCWKKVLNWSDLTFSYIFPTKDSRASELWLKQRIRWLISAFYGRSSCLVSVSQSNHKDRRCEACLHRFALGSLAYGHQNPTQPQSWNIRYANSIESQPDIQEEWLSSACLNMNLAEVIL